MAATDFISFFVIFSLRFYVVIGADECKNETVCVPPVHTEPCTVFNASFSSKQREANVTVNSPVIYHFFPAREHDKWDLVQLAIGVDPKVIDDIKKSPVSVTLHAKNTTLSFTIPFGPKYQYYRRELWLCPKLLNNRLYLPRKVKKIKDKSKKRHHQNHGDSKQQRIFDPNELAAIATITTFSAANITVNTTASSMSLANFQLDVDWPDPANATPKSTGPWVRIVSIPEGVDAVRINAASTDDMCAVLAIQEINTCPFFTLDDFVRAYRRLTFTREGSIVVQRSELESFFVVIFPFPDDSACGGSGNPIHGRPNQKKSVKVRATSVNTSFVHFALPVISTFVFYGLFFLAVAPIKIVNMLTKSPSTDQPVPSIRCEDDALMDASVSRCVSPPAREERRAEEPETGQLLTIASTSSSVVNEEAATSTNPFAAMERPEASAALITAGVEEDFSKLFTKTEKDVMPKEGAAVQSGETREVVIQDDPLVRQRIRRRASSQSSPSDVSCLVVEADGTAARLDLDTPTRSYAWIHTILCGFLLLVVIQQTAWVYPRFVLGGDMDVCYYNGRCGTPLGPVHSFNHSISNVGYVALGVLALMILRKRYTDHKRDLTAKGSHYVHSFGLPTHFGMMTALSIAMVSQGLLSAVYHQCPNSSSIQFESINVYLTAMLALLKLYGSRHEPTEAHVAYGVAFAFWTLATVSSVTNVQFLWWLSFCIMEFILMPLLSLQVYYHGHVAYSTASLKVAKQSIERVLVAELRQGNWKPLFRHRLTALFVFNVVNIIASLYVASSSSLTMSEYILTGLIINFILYFLYYLGNKISANEKIHKLTWFYLVASLVFWLAALKYFFAATIDWKVTPAQSRALNQECVFLAFYDSHDLWHLFSSVATFFSFMSLLTLDDQLKLKRREEIAVF